MHRYRLHKAATLALLTIIGMGMAANAYSQTKNRFKANAPQSVQEPKEISNTYIKATIADNGQFTFTTVSGDPTNPNDDNQRLLYSPIGTSSVALRDNGSTIYSNYDPSNSPVIDLGTRVQGATNINSTLNRTIWNLGGNFEVTQELQLINSPLGANADVVLITYKVVNISGSSRTAELRLILDTQLGANDGAPFQVPGIGADTTETLFSGSTVPEFIQGLDNLTSPLVQSTGVFFGGDAVQPSKVVLARWQSLTTSLFDYSLVGGRFTDSAIGIYWPATSVSAGDTVVFATYYGVGAIKRKTGSYYNIGVAATRRANRNGDGDLVPNPFTVLSYLQNITGGTLNSVNCTLLLPEDWSVTGSNPVNVGNLAQGQQVSATWAVQVPEFAEGYYNFGILYSPTNNATQDSITYTLYIPRKPRPRIKHTETLAFGDVEVGSSSTLSFTVTDTGDAVLTVSALDIFPVNGGEAPVQGKNKLATAQSDSVFKVVNPPVPFNVAPGNENSVTVYIKFTPPGISSQDADLDITSNDPFSSTTTIHLSGNGVPEAPAVDSASVTPNKTKGIGLHTFFVHFDQEMDNTIDPNVTYGLLFPYKSYTLPEGSWEDDGQTYTVEFSIAGNASDGLYTFAVDSAKNIFGASAAPYNAALMLLDTTAPITTSNADSAWRNTSFPITLTPNDGGGSGVDSTFHRIDSGSFTPGTSFTVSDTGVHSISFYSKDELGNQEQVVTFNSIRIDVVAPNSTAILPDSVNSFTVPVAWSGFDNRSGIRDVNIWYRKDKTPTWLQWPGSFNYSPVNVTLNIAGKYFFEVVATDYASNAEARIDGIDGTGEDFTLVTPKPVIAVSPSPYNFGNVHVDSSKNNTFTVSNTGDADLIVTNITATNTSGGIFTIQGPTSFTVHPDNDTTFVANFNPLNLGSNSGRIVITSNDLGSPDSVNVSGTGVAPNVTAPASLAFGQVLKDSTKTDSIYVGNNGDIALAVTSITSNNPLFADINPTSFVVNPGNSVAVHVSFTPDSAKAESGTLSIFSNDPDNNPKTVSLTGTGIPDPPLVINTVISPSAQLNTGAVAIRITFDQTMNTAVQPVMTFGETPPYDQNSAIGNWVGGSSTEWQGSFLEVAPLDSGLYTIKVTSGVNLYGTAMREFTGAQLRIDHTAPVTTSDATLAWHNANFNITLTATDAGAGVDSTFYRLNGGSKTAGTFIAITTEGANHSIEFWSKDKAGIEETHKFFSGIKLDKTKPSATASAPATASTATFNVSWSGSDNLSGISHVQLWYRFNGGAWQKKTVADSSSSPIAFTAFLGNGTYDFEVIAVDSAANSEVRNSVVEATTVVNIPQPGIATVDVVYFGIVRAGTTANDTLQVKNVGGDTLRVSSVIHTNSAQFTISGPGAFNLAPNATQDLFVTFTPSDTVSYADTVKIASNDTSDALRKVLMKGSGGVPLISTNAAPSDSFFFGNVALGTSEDDTIEIHNDGQLPLTVTNVTLGGANPGFFSIQSATAFTVAPAGFNNLIIRYTPTEVDTHFASVLITNNSSNANPTKTAYVSGSGVSSDLNAPAAPISLIVTPGGWTNTASFTLNWTNPEDESGINGARYKIGAAPSNATDGTMVSGANLTSIVKSTDATLLGTKVWYVWLVDGAGNSSHLNTATVTTQFDNVPPVTASNAKTTYYTSDAVIQLTPTDAHSGISSTNYKVNNGTTQTGTTATIITEGKNNSLEFWSTDVAGNVETHRFATAIKIDKTKPASQANAPATATTATFNIPYSASDNVSGVNFLELWYRFNGSTWLKAAGKFTASPIGFTASLGNGTYDFEAVATDSAGNVETINRVVESSTVVNIITGIDGRDEVSTDFALTQNYPNPFNPTTTIEYALPRPEQVRILIYDVRGALVRTLLDGVEQPQGYHRLSWNGRNDRDDQVSSGVYFYRIQAGSFTQVKKMLLIK